MRTLGILLLDSVRLLRSQKLFWVVLSLSGLVALLYASLGFDKNGVTLFFGLLSFDHEMLRADSNGARNLYLLIFTNIIVPWWLGVIAIVLALISCASIFPEFVRKGSVDLVLSKPRRRITLFMGKYIGSLCFVLLQVFPFTLIVFLSFGLRFGEWSLGLFWAVPLVLLVFSYVYAMHVLVSVWSGSMVFGLLAAGFVWGLAVLAEWTEFMAFRYAYTVPRMGIELDLTDAEGCRIGDSKDNAGPGMVFFHKVANAIRAPLPKTRSGGNQMRELIRVGEEGLTGKTVLGTLFQVPEEVIPDHLKQAQRLEDLRHPVWKDVGSSLFYELAVVGLAGWIFCRRDY